VLPEFPTGNGYEVVYTDAATGVTVIPAFVATG